MLFGVTWCYLVLLGVTWCYLVLFGVTWYTLGRIALSKWSSRVGLLKSWL